MTEHTTVPGNDRDEDVAVLEDASTSQSGHSRRIFLAGAGAGALGTAAVAATVTAAPAAAAGTADAVEFDGAAMSAQAVVAYVSDGSRGEITLFRGGREVVVQDRTLARALASRFDQALARTTNQER